MPREATWIDFRDSSDSLISLLYRRDPQHFREAATTNQSRTHRTDCVVMLAEPCGRSEMNASNRDLECSSKLNPGRSHFRIGVRIIFERSTSSWLNIQAHGFRIACLPTAMDRPAARCSRATFRHLSRYTLLALAQRFLGEKYWVWC